MTSQEIAIQIAEAQRNEQAHAALMAVVEANIQRKRADAFAWVLNIPEAELVALRKKYEKTDTPASTKRK